MQKSRGAEEQTNQKLPDATNNLIVYNQAGLHPCNQTWIWKTKSQCKKESQPGDQEETSKFLANISTGYLTKIPAEPSS